MGRRGRGEPGDEPSVRVRVGVRRARVEVHGFQLRTRINQSHYYVYCWRTSTYYLIFGKVPTKLQL